MSARRASVAALVVAAVALAVVVRSNGEGHRVHAVFASAHNTIAGLDVRVAGRKVGHIAEIHRDGGQVRLELELGDESWPLRRGTTARVRYGGTIRYGNRYVELDPGPDSAAEIPDGGLLSTAETEETVEFDEILNVYDPRTRAQFRGLVENAGAAFGARSDDLERLLQRGPGAFTEVEALLGELRAADDELATLITAGRDVSHQLAREDDSVEELVSAAASTFDELAEGGRDVTRSIERMPGTLDRMTHTLGRVNGTLEDLDAVARAIRPGARAVSRLAPVADAALGTLAEVAPDAASTLATGRRAAPDISALVREAGPFATQLGSVAEGLEPAVRCVRPYGPEIAAFAATWAGFSKNHDSTDHYARTLVVTPPFPYGSTLTPAQLVPTIPGVNYAYPRPPGLNAGQPWFIEGCGVGPETLDPAQDPEARPAGSP